MLKFLIAVDGSEHSKNAIEAVVKLVGASAQLEVLLLNVRSEPSLYGELTPTTYHELDAAVRAEQARVLEEAADQARAGGLIVAGTLAPSGMVASEIVRAASEARVDQIVLGTRGMGAMGGLFLGSVAQRVVHQANVPVLLVK
jgi:nucleotide-binding universal stress UspA family protein